MISFAFCVPTPIQSLLKINKANTTYQKRKQKEKPREVHGSSSCGRRSGLPRSGSWQPCHCCRAEALSFG